MYYVDSDAVLRHSLQTTAYTSLIAPAPPGLSNFIAENFFRRVLEHLTLEILVCGRQKPAFSHFVARIFKKILAEQLTHFIRYLL